MNTFLKCLTKNLNALKYVDNPPLLYKYREWGNNLNHKKVLLFNELFFANPSAFHDDDPEECRINVKKSYSEINITNALNDLYMIQHPKYNKSSIERLVNTHNRNGFNHIDLYQQEFQRMDDEFNKKIGILCLTANPRNKGLWENYSNKNKGVCYGFKIPELYNDLNSDGKLTAAKVRYSQKKAEFDLFVNPEINVHRRLFCKNRKYSFEDEFRLKKVDMDNSSSFFANSSLDSIHLGSAMSKDDREEILEIVRTKQLNVTIYQCEA